MQCMGVVEVGYRKNLSLESQFYICGVLVPISCEILTVCAITGSMTVRKKAEGINIF